MYRKYPRAHWHNYCDGTYFVTVCTRSRAHYFGCISNGEIAYTVTGKYLCRAIEEISEHYPYAVIRCFIVMPNHFHAIISIAGSRHAAALTENTGCLRPPRHPDDGDNFDGRNHFNALLSRVIGGVKSAVTRYARSRNIEFGWQLNFHDHKIRNQREYNLIAEYIDKNVETWAKDRFFAHK